MVWFGFSQADLCAVLIKSDDVHDTDRTVCVFFILLDNYPINFIHKFTFASVCGRACCFCACPSAKHSTFEENVTNNLISFCFREKLWKINISVTRFNEPFFPVYLCTYANIWFWLRNDCIQVCIDYHKARKLRFELNWIWSS